MPDLMIYLAYMIAGFGTACLLDTLVEYQDGPEISAKAWFVVALIWPGVLLAVGLFVAWKMLAPK